MNDILQTVQDLAQNTDMTIIFVTHHTEEILDVFPNSLLLQNGKVYAKGETKALFSSETLSEFLNYPVQVSWKENRIQVELEVESNMKQLMEQL